jgi:hypothetical protein
VAWRHVPLPGRRRRHFAPVRDPDDLPDADRDPRELRRREARARIYGRVPGARDVDGRHLRGARSRSFLCLLRRRPDPDVPHHRHLGRGAASLCDFQVFPLHARRLGADAARHDGDVLAVGHVGRDDATHAQFPGIDADLAVPGLLRIVRGEAAHVAGAHLVAGRACGSADSGLGDPGGDFAEARRLRLPAFLAADVPRGFRILSRR